MHRLGHSEPRPSGSGPVQLLWWGRRFRLPKTWALIILPAVLPGQEIARVGNRWVMTVTGSVPAASRLRVTSQGPVRVEGASGNEVSYTAQLSVEARSLDDARRILSQNSMRVVSNKGQVVLTTPAGPVTTSLTIKAPRLKLAVIRTSEGSVEASAIDGDLEVNSGGGDLKCDRIRGDCNLSTAGGDIQVGDIGGDLQCGTAGGHISVKNVRGDAVLETAGGRVEIDHAGGDVRVDTAGGAVIVGDAAGDVAAASGGGAIEVGRAGGVVTVRAMAGPVQVGAAAGVRCESGSGGVRLSNIAGPMQVSTAMGSIIATLLAGKSSRDSFLQTGNGDVTVLIPSNLGVNIRAAADRGRVVSDFPGIAQHRVGVRLLAEGPVNGGGPVLTIAGAGGTIFIKKQ
jgi:DUF4097 and DUF4098 domain-containing protein YvlB